MADVSFGRRRPPPSPSSAAARSPAAPDPLDVAAFDASSLTVYLKDAVALVLENRPDDPVAFIAEYLRRVLHGASPVARAHQYLTLSPHHRDAFVDNAVVAHDVLGAASGPRGVVTGAQHAALLERLCEDFPPETRRVTVDAFARAPDDAVDFFEFLGGAKTCRAMAVLLEELDEEERRGGREGGGREGEGEGGGEDKDAAAAARDALAAEVARAAAAELRGGGGGGGGGGERGGRSRSEG